MAKFDNHPTVRWWREQSTTYLPTSTAALNADALRSPKAAGLCPSLCLEAGADDVGFVEIHRPAIADQHSDVLAAFPPTKTLISFVCQMNRENIRTPTRSAANLEFHANYDYTNIDYNPCLECKLCVAACPVGAIAADGYFNFSACYTHNYREFMSGFTDWAETIADSKNARLPFHLHGCGVPPGNGDHSRANRTGARWSYA